MTNSTITFNCKDCGEDCIKQFDDQLLCDDRIEIMENDEEFYGEEE